MSKRNCITIGRLRELCERCSAAGIPWFGIAMDNYPYRKKMWAALHNALNRGHPKAPRKPHKWTAR